MLNARPEWEGAVEEEFDLQCTPEAGRVAASDGLSASPKLEFYSISADFQ
jgi:hypothetical protein